MTYLINVFDEENIFEENDTVEVAYRTLSEKDLSTIVKLAMTLNMKCLSLISHEQDTIFNMQQAQHIKKEIALLRHYEEINKIALDVIQKGAEEATKEEFLYLKIYKSSYV